MNKLLACILLLPVWLSSLQVSSSVSDKAVVHAVLFYSPTCGHCHYVITEVLPPLYTQYGEQLSIVGLDVTQSDGQALFLAALQHFNLESSGVPFLVIGDTYLVGSVDIPEKFPGLIEQYLAQGGVGWPAIPGLAEAMTAAQNTQAPTPTPQSVPTQEAITPSPALPVATPTTAGLILTSDMNLSLWERLERDPAGNGLALVVLAGMILVVILGVIFFRRSSGAVLPQSCGWFMPVLCIIGLGVAGYLTYVETALVEAICGPVGDCNTVQQSEYARLFGLIPIGVLGLAGYVMILLVWGVEHSADQRLAAYASLVKLGMTAFGVLFSIYLTFLEPFIIGATCAWCLTSAVIMTALFWLSLAPAWSALLYLLHGGKYTLKRSSS
jgi:uncharacterized membrane protein/thiol-disulfide isomerase/thioredoxin